MNCVAATALALLTALSVHAAELGVAVTDVNGKPLEGAVVWLTAVSGKLPAAPTRPVVVDQIQRRFTPVISVIQTGTSVEFPNSDNIRHSVYSFSAPRTFTLKLYSGKPAAAISFDQPGVVVLGCNIHDRMIAWIAVVDSAWFARSDGAGMLTLRSVPEGDYALNTWHPGSRRDVAAQPVSITATNSVRSIAIDAASIASLLPDTEGKKPMDHH